MNSAYVTALTVASSSSSSISGAYALTRLRPPGRALLFLLVLAPLIVPTEVLIVPLFSMFRALGLINSLPGLALDQRRGERLVRDGDPRGLLPHDPAGPHRCRPGRRSGPGRGPAPDRDPARAPGILAVAVLVAVFTWNDFAGALVLIQRPDAFTVQLALTHFSTFYATDQGLTFAGMAIVILPPLLLFLVLQRSFIQGLTAGAVRR